MESGETSVDTELRANTLAQTLNSGTFASSSLPQQLSKNGFEGVPAVELSTMATLQAASSPLTNDIADSPSGPSAATMIVVAMVVLGGVGVAAYVYSSNQGGALPASREEKQPLRS